jgi:hypothetical protein
MLGDPEVEKKRGIIPRALENLFRETKNDTQHVYNFQVAYLQIYMEMVRIVSILKVSKI